MEHKICYGKCDRCAWKTNGGCSEWNGYGGVINDCRTL